MMIENLKPRITISKNGSYCVQGPVPFVRKTQVVSENGEPLTWKKEFTIETDENEYYLCRCGNSQDFPFCDSTHRRVPFEGTETAEMENFYERQYTFPGGTNLVVRKNPSLCMNSGFCGLLNLKLRQIIPETDNTQKRSLVIAMVERCPSGALTYAMNNEDAEIEPDLPVQIADTTEITDDGPIIGPLWVTGEIEIERSDGKLLKTRNRVTLCNCGRSEIKPLCDGTHRTEPRMRK
jgi:CDGSH-type Zn-finger protein